MANQLSFAGKRVCILGLTSLLCVNSFGTAVAETDGEKRHGPNIVLIFVDDQGYYDLGCYGATEVKTPRIDAMAQEGTRFTDYYAAAPICSPSRAGLLTGCYPRRVGNADLGPSRRFAIRHSSRRTDDCRIAEGQAATRPPASASGISDFTSRSCRAIRGSITISDCCTILTRSRSSTSRTREACR